MTAPTLAASPATAESRRIASTLDRHAGFSRLRAVARLIYRALENYGQIRAIRALHQVDPALARRLAQERTGHGRPDEGAGRR